ncbi:cysteine-rich and transmembrane domain-containing A [Olea europaea subsp. europaea]|uniref:Cysteine-rich and transmembrane domain-containing A n=2 Tax=Olea europaea subsp. europaea TaxID=158383 RepID=A0A8S0QFZ2_OLEEU|nr:cysteine-rich and transmembrane domain-containing A [Olea europaea subsp. europaea]
MQNQVNQPPPGYPTEDPPTEKKKKKMKFWSSSKPKGERGFLEGCLFGLCCCWLCEVCC